MEFGSDWFEYPVVSQPLSLASHFTLCFKIMKKKWTEADLVPVGSWQKVNLPLSLSP